KTYVFHIRHSLHFADGTPVDATRIGYNFSDVKTETPNPDTVIYHLKEAYAPFLVTVSRPIFKDVLVGIGDYKVAHLKLNGSFIEFIELGGINGKDGTQKYVFYPTHDALKTAYTIGEVNHVIGLTDATFGGKPFTSFANTSVAKKVEQERLVTIFYNTKDPMLSDKKIREALSYAIPNEFSSGKRNMSPLP